MGNPIRSFLHPLLSVSVERYRSVLGIPKNVFAKQFALYNAVQPGARVSRYSSCAVTKLEELVNQKGVLAEDRTKPPFERLSIAMDWAQESNSTLAQQLGVSRELVRKMRLGAIGFDAHLEALGRILQVPPKWLVSGNPLLLPADSHIGVRCGAAQSSAREDAYEVLEKICEEHKFKSVRDLILTVEKSVREIPTYANVCRQAGGRWNVIGDRAFFFPWVAVDQVDSAREQLWEPEIEVLIEQGLNDQDRTTTQVWDEVKAYAEQRGLPYPTKITLHKRVARAHQRLEKFGMDPSVLASFLDSDANQPEQLKLAA